MENEDLVQLIIKVPKELRDSFKKLTMLNDSTMANEIRAFMEKYVNQYQAPTVRKKKQIKRKPKIEEGKVDGGEES